MFLTALLLGKFLALVVTTELCVHLLSRAPARWRGRLLVAVMTAAALLLAMI